ncbi:hypothetical protein KY385_00275 [Candidatus Parcubacteria bacterium]|nr:hypothetical protein [Candidatus Parcubacteria bacterium]
MLRKKGAFYCFSPPVMLATFFIETAYILYILLRYKVSPLTRLAIGILSLLALFQLAEYFVCTGSSFAGQFWSRVAFVSITFLPALGIHFVYKIAGRPWNNLVGAAYGMAIAWVVVLAFLPGIFSTYKCGGNYVIFDFNNLGGPYFIYYYFWLFIGTIMALKFSLNMAKAQKKTKQALMMFIVSYLALLVPTTILNTINPQIYKGIPSIMCGFAVIMATIITFLILPRIAKLRNQQE